MEAKHLDYLDGWRGFAILLLLAGHFSLIPKVLGHSIYTGRVGVECFFILSGRLMAEILFVKKTPIAVFYQRRISRIFPALWTFVLALLVLGVIGVMDAIKALSFTANYFPAGDNLDHVWSLCVEEHAYVILSMLAVLNRTSRLNVSEILFVASALCIANGAFQTWIMHRYYYQVYWHTDVRVASVFLSAGLYLRLRDINQIQLGPLPIISVVAGLAISTPASIADPIKYSVGTLLITIGFLTVDRGWSLPLRLLSLPPLTYFGVLSFSVYLWQQPFFILSASQNRFVMLVAAILLGVMSFYFVERPLRATINKLRLPAHLRAS